jgi:hypothetical protein
MLLAALTGDLRAAADLGERFADGWERAGRPRTSNLAICACAAAAAAELLGREELAERLRGVVAALLWDRPGDVFRYAVFDVMPPLHRGEPEAAHAVMALDPEAFPTWFNGLWRPWYAAAWAEAGVLAGIDPAERIPRARPLVRQNPVAALLLDRAAALAGDPAALPAVADALDAAGARYQAARTRVLAGGALRARGETELAAIGTVPPG